MQIHLVSSLFVLFCFAIIAFSSALRQDPPPAKQYDSLKAQMMVSTFSNEVFLIKEYTFFDIMLLHIS